MSSAQGAIDCDIHPAVPGMKVLLPYLDDYWRETVVTRGIDSMRPLPAIRRTRRSAAGRTGGRRTARPAATSACCRPQALDAFGARYAICNCLYGGQAARQRGSSARLSAARSTTGSPSEWLDRDPRLRASIVVPHAESRAGGRGDRAPRRRPALRPGAAAADGRDCRSAAAITGRSTRPPSGTACRSASMPAASYRHAPTSLGWPSFYLRGLCRAVAGLRAAAAQPGRRGRVRQVPEAARRADRVRRHLAAGASCGAPARPGAACAPRCRGSRTRRPTSSASMSA